MTQSFTLGHLNIQMARYIFLHATQFLALLLLSTNVNNYSPCGDLQLDTKKNHKQVYQQSMWHVGGFSSQHDSAMPPPGFIPHHMSTMHIPHSRPYMHFFPFHYYARYSTSTCQVVLTTIKWPFLWASDPKGS
jgi:hypothetical protein